MTKIRTLEAARKPAAALDTPTDLSEDAVREISTALNGLLADAFALYLKTKNFHWHVSGPHFRDYHLLLDEQAEQIFATTDELAERVRKVGGTTLRSIGDIAKHQSIEDNDAPFVAPNDMLRELMADNKAMAAAMRKAHEVADKHEDVGDGEPARDLHRRHREAHLVPVRGEPQPRQVRPLTRRRDAQSSASRHPPHRLDRGAVALLLLAPHLRGARRLGLVARRGRLGRLPDQRDQPLARVLAVAQLAAEARGRDDDHAVAGHAPAGQLVEPLRARARAARASGAHRSAAARRSTPC